jgi:hypothetical protein
MEEVKGTFRSFKGPKEGKYSYGPKLMFPNGYSLGSSLIDAARTSWCPENPFHTH